MGTVTDGCGSHGTVGGRRCVAGSAYGHEPRELSGHAVNGHASPGQPPDQVDKP